MHTGAGDATYYSMESSRCETVQVVASVEARFAALALLVVLCLTLGLAPFTPQPHVWEKLQMLVAGELVRPIDIFDLLLHATPWMLLILKLSLYRSEES